MTIRLGTLVVDLGQADTGINRAVRGVVQTTSGEVEAFVKRLLDPREILVESVCAVLARNLNLPVPEPLLVFVPEALGGPGLAFGSTAMGYPNLTTWIHPSDQAAIASKLKTWRDLVRAACFDEWIANCDRHQGNLLFDGGDNFWLIDHGLAIHEQMPVEALAPGNALFSFAVSGLPEGDLLALRPKALGVMEAYAAYVTTSIEESLPSGFWSTGLKSAVFAWLQTRQNHLLRLGSERIPARQSELFDGRNPS